MKRYMLVPALVAAVSTGLMVAPNAFGAPATNGGTAAETNAPAPGSPEDPAFGTADRAAAIAAAQARVQETASQLGLAGRQHLVVKNVVRDTNGESHIRYDRTYAGLPVIGGDFITHNAPDGSIRTTDFATEAELTALPTVKPQVAAQSAVRDARQLTSLNRVDQRPRLTVYAVGADPKLAWETVVGGADENGDPERRVVYTDAASGETIKSWSELQHATGTGKSLYSGQVRITTAKVGNQFRMRDIARGNHPTHDALNGTGLGNLFVDANNVWGNGTNANRQSAGVDAHYGAAKTWDYYKNRHNRLGIRNDGVGALSRVHYDVNYENAFWSDSCFCMTYGDGGTVFRPLVSLDVAGHEMTHGVTSNTAGLIYFGESGGLNEATSDIYGSMVEFYAANTKDKGDYIIGEKITKVAPGFLRRMDHPSLDGSSYNCYTPTMGADDVHYTSGPANHFFYLLAEGSGAKVINGRQHNSPTCNNSHFGGIGRTAAAKIWYRALNVYMTSTTDYRDARDATIRAARDIYGKSSKQCNRVTRSWNAVTTPSQNWSCNGLLPGPGGANLVVNPGFESGNVGWVNPNGVITNNPGAGFPHAGSWWAALNGQGVSNTDTLSQSVTIPNRPQVRLRFHLLVSTGEGGGVFDTLQVQAVRGGSVETLRTYSNGNASNSYTQRSIDLSPYRGQTVTLRFVGSEDGSLPTWFFIDDVSVRTN